jgi:hypothetical protein
MASMERYETYQTCSSAKELGKHGRAIFYNGDNAIVFQLMFEQFRLTLLKERVSLKRLHKIVLTISNQGNYYILRNDAK